MKKLEWNVYESDFNSKDIKVFNIFNHVRFADDVKKDLKKCKTKEEFAEKLRGNLMYYYGSKYEWETVITSFPSRIDRGELQRLNADFAKDTEQYGHEPYSMYVNPTVGKKIDVYQQCMLNFEKLCDYVWGNKKV